MPGKPITTKAVLGVARARAIVSNCADSTNWNATLSQLAVNHLVFRNCVSAQISEAGFVPPVLTAGPNTKLSSVAADIQNSPQQ